MNKLMLIGALVVTVGGCTSTLQEINSGLSAVNEGLGAPAKSVKNRPMSRETGQASITLAQQEKIEANTRSVVKDASLNNALSEAEKVIQAFIAENSCITDYNGSSLNKYAASGKIYPRTNYIGAPMNEMKYQSKDSCASVLRISGWEMRSKNALRFEVSYISDLSGEVVKKTNEVVKQPNGEWLFTR